MNCEQSNSGDNYRRCEDNKFNEYNNWPIPFNCNICHCRYFNTIYVIQKDLRRIKGNA